MANLTKGSVIRFNNQEFDSPRLMTVPCGTGTIAEGVYWRVPVVDGLGTLVRFDYKIAETAPSLDSNKVIRVRDNQTQNIYWILILATADLAAYNDKCNICCGNNSDMDAVVYIRPVIETIVCADTSGNYTQFTFVDALGSNEEYYPKASVAGALLTPAAPGDGFASLAALKTWLNSNWNTGGLAWDYSGSKVTMVGTTNRVGSISVRKYKYWESNAPGALGGGQTTYTLTVTVNGVVIGTAAATTLAGVVTAANASAALSAKGLFSLITSTKIRLASGADYSTVVLTIAMS